MTSISTSGRCAACGAPNPAGRTGCWSCAEPLLLAAPSATTHAPDAFQRACPGCGTVSAVYHRLCPGCGQPLNAACPGLLHPEPSGWVIQTLSDGTVLMRRTRWSRLVPIVATAFGLLTLVWVTVTWTMPHNAGLLSDPVENGVNLALQLLAMLIAVGILAISLLWQLCGGEEWRVAANSLIIRRTVFGRSWAWRSSDATLEIRTWWQRYGRTTSLTAVTASERRVLKTEWWGRSRTEALARYLSRLTGWPVADLGNGIW